MGREKIHLMAVFLTAALCLAGCGSKGTGAVQTAATMSEEAAADYGAGEIYEQGYEEAPAEEPAAAEAGEKSVASNRKLIKNINMSVETEEFDALIAKVESRTDALGGYIENLNVYNNNGSYGQTRKNAYITIRIPKDQLDNFVTEVAEVSNVISRREETVDVTMEYVDLESHKRVLEAEQDRLIEFLSKAETMEEIIALEERLSQIRYELESMESQLRTYDNLVDYSTVRLDISEVETLTPVKEISAVEKMTGGFMASLRNLARGLTDFFIGLVIFLPYLIFTGLLVLIVLLIVRAATRKQRDKETKRMQEMQREKQTDDSQPDDKQL